MELYILNVIDTLFYPLERCHFFKVFQPIGRTLKSVNLHVAPKVERVIRCFPLGGTAILINIMLHFSNISQKLIIDT